MFKQLHLKLTLFCTAITGLILITMTCICLYFSESNLMQNGNTSFLNDLNSMLIHLESQSTISLQWIAQMEKNHQFLISIYDNGKPLFYQDLRRSQTEKEAIQKAMDTAKADYGLDLNTASASGLISKHVEFKLTAASGEEFYASAIMLPKNSGHLSVVILQTLETQKKQILQQRWSFVVIDLGALLLLGTFFWFFTWKILHPIEESRQQQAQFIASASHELRSPLAVMLSCLTAAEKAPPLEAAHFTDTIRAEGKRMSHLIEEMLQLANADSHSWNMKFQPAALDTLLLTTYEKYEYLAMDKKIALSISLPEEDIPEVNCDEERISQVLSILLDNALSYTPKNGSIRLSLCQESGHICLSVSDNGPGIPDAEKKQIFQRFYRRDKAHTSKSHFGLGLSIAKEIMRLHKGKLVITDTKGGGATFTVIL